MSHFAACRRASAQRVCEHVHIGSIEATFDGYIQQHRITRVVSMLDLSEAPEVLEALAAAGVTRLERPALDEPNYDISADLVAAVKFVLAGVRHGEQVLVHCHAGISRSASVVAMYLMCRGASLERALRHMRAVRPCVRPNRGFMERLSKVEHKLRARGHVLAPPLPALTLAA